MYTINRSLVRFIPKKPLIDWANSTNGPADVVLSMEDYSGHDKAMNFLIPEFDSAEEALQWMADDWETWFEVVMEDWLPYDYFNTRTKPEYPLPPSWENLLLLFSLEYDSHIVDSMPGPIRKERM